MKKMIIILGFIGLLICCNDFPLPDILTGAIPMEVTIENPSRGSMYEIGDPLVIRWTITPYLSADLKIELLNESKLIKVLAEKTENDGIFSMQTTNLPMQAGYRIRLTIANGVFTGESWLSDEFIMKKSWDDLDFISEEEEGACWGTSTAMDNDGNLYVMYQENNLCLSVKRYNGDQWINLEIEDNIDTYWSSYFSMNLTKSKELVVVYTKNISDAVVKRWIPIAGTNKWESLPFLTTIQLAFGLSVAAKDDGNPIISFSTMEKNAAITRSGEIQLDYIFDYTPFLRTRFMEKIEGSDDPPLTSWLDNMHWLDEGNTILPNPNFGTGILGLNIDFWQTRLVTPIHHFIIGNPGIPSNIDEPENREKIISLQSDFYTSIALDQDKIPYVAYVDGDIFARGIFVIKKDNGNWIRVGERVSDKHSSGMVSLAMDNNNNPVVAYKLLKEETVMVKAFECKSWNSLGIAGPAKNTYPSLAINDNGRIFVAAGQWVKEWDPGNNVWNPIGFPVKNGGGFHPQWMSVNSTHIAVAYVDEENENRIHVKTRTLPQL